MVSIKSVILNILRAQMPPKGKIQIGAFTSGTPFIISPLRSDNVTIGKFCSIAADSVIIPNNGHIPPSGYDKYRVSTFPLARLKKNGWRSEYSLPNEAGSVVVGNDVWIGTRAIILSGVTIGDGAIIGAGAVVTRNVPPYAVVAGVPAKVIRFRYTQEQIAALLRIAWWNWNLDKIRSNMDYFYCDVDNFITKFS
jgi:acetyltransferase-like isoleucine patch superfamily enzyme